ncbi:MAG: hypothetical protein GOMPHAMPRED_008272 [Gomphillus americanus]|uniref:Cytochrome P450 n=1 Tax=Gomphillus americanus TaxID=1940652 RepID=A0A8H3F322_9LECA|nr:MAG: hypothetical protein GOMPHAMPRED_008272 [Gomphillus americanus]
MLKTIGAVLVAIFSLVSYYVYDLIQKRRQLDGLPQPPMKNLLLGHLHLADECSKLFKGLHPHVYANYLRSKYNLPEVFYIDWRPFGPLWVMFADPELASKYITTEQSLQKSLFETEYVDCVLGKGNMVTIEGAHHKFVRSMFNPGFSLNNIMSMAGQIVDDVVVFRNKLRKLAETNEWFQMEEEATQLTIDVIGRLTFDVSLDCQKQPHKIARLFRQRLLLLGDQTSIFPWEDVSLTRPFKLWWNYRQLDKAINDELDAKILRRANELSLDGKSSKKSSIDLALNAYEKEQAMGNIIGEKKGLEAIRIDAPHKLPASLRTDLNQSIKTFIFAGHDTSSSVISWSFYLLHRYPECQAKVTEELNTIFGVGSDIAEKIKTDPYLLNKCHYLTAIVKEAMRLFNPASTLRSVNGKLANQKTTLTDPKTGQTLPMLMSNNALWPLAHMIHRNTRFFPEPTKFVPERFLPSQTPYPDAELFTPAGKDAFRPFEKGPRNCIGQELAMTEIKITLAICVRDLDFVVEYPGEAPDPQPPIPESAAAEVAEGTEYGDALRGAIKTGKPFVRRYEGHRTYQILKGSAKPDGGLPGRIYLRK